MIANIHLQILFEQGSEMMMKSLCLQFLMKAIVINLFVGLIVPILGFYFQPSQQPSKYEFGHSSLYFETFPQKNNIRHEQRHFSIQPLNKYSSQSAVVAAIAAFQLGPVRPENLGRQNLKAITLMVIKEHGQVITVKATLLGSMVKVKMSYLIVERSFQQQSGVRFWNNLNGQTQNTIGNLQLKIVQELYQKKQDQAKLDPQNRNQQQELMLGSISKEKKVVAFLSTLIIQDGLMINLLEVKELYFEGKIEVKVTWPKQLRLNEIKPLYNLAIKVQVQANFQGTRLEIYDETSFVTAKEPLILASDSKQLSFLFGIRQIDSPCSKLEFTESSQADTFQIELNILPLPDHLPQKYAISYALIRLKSNQTTQISTIHRALQGCSSGTYYSKHNWTSIALSSSTQLPGCFLGFFCNKACKPCPIGCSSCSDATWGCSLPVTCSACKSGFTKTSTGVCSGQNYCNCPANQYPNVYTGSCQSCATVIPNCQSCSIYFFFGTFCASCTPGFYPTASGYPRGCAACTTACTNCTSLTTCTKCSSNMIAVNGYCTCNTTNSLYYNTGTSNCTLCSLAITNCVTCAQAKLATTCTLCKTGYYVGSGSTTCVLCPTYCSACTSTNCTQCVSSSFTPVGMTCVCSSNTFLNTTSTPTTCVACSKFQNNCTTCTNSSNVVLCSVCVSGYFLPSSGICAKCPTNCLSCDTALSCTTCVDNAAYDSGSDSCVCNSNYILSGTSCVLCSLMIVGCQYCDTVLLTCSTCAPGFYASSANPGSCDACSPTCTACSGDATTCSSCVAGYDGAGCATLTLTSCSGSPPVTNCATCSGNNCQTCIVGSYYDSASNTCKTCPTSCSSCSPTACNTCISPYVWISSSCVCNAALDQYYTTGPTICEKCALIITNCTNCVAASSTSTTCTSCEVGTYLATDTLCTLCPSNCTQCTTGAVCTECLLTFLVIDGACKCDTASQYFLNLNSNTCKFCSLFISYCTTCQVNGSTSSKVGCAACFFGYYNDALDACTQCPSTCASCTASNACNSCQSSYSLINGACECDASLQLFNSGTQCLPCYTFVSYCTHCSKTTSVVCLSCVAGTYLNIPLNTSCILCGSNCDSCNAAGCLTCTLGFAPDPVSGICVYTNQCLNYTNADVNCVYCAPSNTNSTICLSCQAGFYLVNQASCVACPQTCATCSDYSSCLVCSSTFTLVSGICTCDVLKDQVLSNSLCVSCNSLFPNCQSCSGSSVPVQCAGCQPTFYLAVNGSCTSCTYGCKSCVQSGSCSSCINGFDLDANTGICNNIAFCLVTQFYDVSASTPGFPICVTCPQNCSSCLSAQTCITCPNTYSLINGKCQCDASYGMFFSPQNGLCSECGNYNSINLGPQYTQNCQGCVVSSNLAGFSCAVCTVGYYTSSGQCSQCQQGCNDCSGSNSCSSCQSPIYLLVANGSCICNTLVNYFLNGSVCSLCVLQNCTICVTIRTCKSCDPGSFVNSTTQVCQPQICGNGKRQGVEQCDDSNTVDNDGCSSTCKIEQYYSCANLQEGQQTICTSQKSKFILNLAQQIVSCNQIQIKLQNVGTQSASHCNISALLSDYDIPNATLSSYSVQNQYISYIFTFNASLLNETFNLVFNPTTLCLENSANFPQFNVSAAINSNNNKPAIYYPGSSCSNLQITQKFIDAVQYASYAVLILSFPSKVVGLQLLGVLQLSFLTLGSMDNVNLMLQPLGDMVGVNGFNLDLGDDQTSRLLQSLTPQRINSLDYKANFIRNCNLMFLIVFATMAVALVLYITTLIFKKCAPTLLKVANRISKEVLLTLILFNQFNFAYSAGIHFKYAPSEDPLYTLGTLAAAATLVIPVLMAIALLYFQDEGFGQYKDKLKPGCLQRAYFVVTIVYRMCIGLYMSSANQDQLSTLIILAFSILFLLYNLVNLPFTKAYHNYRANICHLTQFVTLFVAMFYRSMKSGQTIEQSSSIIGPVYFQYVLIFVSLLASVIVLAYEIFLFIKERCCKQKSGQTKQQQQQAPNMSLNQLKQNDPNTIKIEETFQGDLQCDKKIDTEGDFEECS